MPTSQSDVRPPWIWPRAGYVHVPFCAYHCGYCDFAVVTGQDHRIDLYLEALAAELSTLPGPQPIDTLFLGGGTPTYLNCGQMERLLRLLREWFLLEPGYEFSIESNPGTFDAGKVAVLADHGVNRLSLGAQSFHPHLLRVLERDHAPEDVRRSVDLARRRIPRISLDLIFGAPGQTAREWQSDLDQALALELGHLSTYGLTYEKGTRLWKQKSRGAVRPLDEDTELAMYVLSMTRLGEVGFEHYEISSFARPGERCRHNQTYWANRAYFGFGLGAARYVEGRREHNTRDLHAYLKKTLAGESPIFQSEVLGPEERARETMSLNLRRAEGIQRQAFQQQTRFDVDVLANDAIRRNIELGYLVDDEIGVRLTRQGKCVADAVIESLL